jgi:hypothetical protein
MLIREIENEWEVDSVVNDINLDVESTRTHGLHFKYYVILNEEKKGLFKLEAEYKVLRLEKWEYFMGILDEEKLKARNWLPSGIKVLKTNIPLYLEADTEIIRSDAQISIQEQKIEFLKSIIDQINRRSFFIKNAIDFKKFVNGVA